MTDLQAKNRRFLMYTLAVVAGMILLSYASVPIYRKICQITGWGGTTQEVKENPYQGKIFDREMTVRFNADVDAAMPWEFKPDLLSVKLKIGQDGFASYTATNKSSAPIAGTAVYNVTPLQAGKYFYKTQCFCFGEQILNPGQSVHMPVTFFVDPKIMEDRDLRDLKTITLSYTFYKKDSQELEKAIENFANTSDNSTSKITK